MVGEGGNYDEPEVNLYAGLQDHGHTYFANSLFYAADKHDIMIYGEGSSTAATWTTPAPSSMCCPATTPPTPKTAPTGATAPPGTGNKAIALVRCENVVLDGIRILNGGHFAIIAEAPEHDCQRPDRGHQPGRL